MDQTSADASANASSDAPPTKVLPYKMVDPQKTGWEERARIYGFDSSLFPYRSLGKEILSPELLAAQKCSNRRLIVSGEQLGAGLPIPLYNPSNPLFYAIYSRIDPPCGVMQLNGNSIRVISEWVARSEGRSYYYKELPRELQHSPDYWSVDNFFRCYKVEKSLSKEKAPWSVSLGKVPDSSHPLGDVDLSGSKKNTLLRHSSDEVWFTKPVLIEGPVLYGYEEGSVERKKFEAEHNFSVVNFYSIFFSKEERAKSQGKIAQAKQRKAEQAKAKSQRVSDESDAPKKRKRSLKSAPAEKGEIGQSDVLTGDGDAASLSLREPNRKRGKTVATKKKSTKAISSSTEAVTRRRTRPFTVLSDDEETEDDRTPMLRGENLKHGAIGMPSSQISVPSRGRSFFDSEVSHSDQPEMNLNQYGSNICATLGFPASGVNVPSIPSAFAQQSRLGSKSQTFVEPNSCRSPHADDLASLLRAHSMDPQNHPLDPSVSGFLAQVFSGSLDKNFVASTVSYHQSFVEAQKYHGEFLIDLTGAQGLEIARFGEDIRLLRQEKSNLAENVKDLEKRLVIAVSERDSFMQDANVQRERASKLDEELRLALGLCEKKDAEISSLNNHIQGEAERTSLFSRDHGRYLFRSLGIQPPYYFDGLEDPGVVLESDKDLVSSSEAELIISELRKARLAENLQAANDNADGGLGIEGHESINLEQREGDGLILGS